jgi:(S)-3,5-dihydroxyphenylglycine transaminase
MNAFFVGGGGQRQLRVSSSYLPPEELEIGIERLAAFITSESAARAAASATASSAAARPASSAGLSARK